MIDCRNVQNHPKMSESQKKEYLQLKERLVLLDQNTEFLKQMIKDKEDYILREDTRDIRMELIQLQKELEKTEKIKEEISQTMLQLLF